MSMSHRCGRGSTIPFPIHWCVVSCPPPPLPFHSSESHHCHYVCPSSPFEHTACVTAALEAHDVHLITIRYVILRRLGVSDATATVISSRILCTVGLAKWRSRYYGSVIYTCRSSPWGARELSKPCRVYWTSPLHRRRAYRGAVEYIVWIINLFAKARPHVSSSPIPPFWHLGAAVGVRTTAT